MGENASFFNIDYHRPSHDEIASFFRENQFDIVGISAVVSTAYAYTKYLSRLIKKESPVTKIIIGGNLAASSEILLKKCEVDYCVIGDGENIIQELVTCIKNDGHQNFESLESIKGICFLDLEGNFRFTGYGEKPSASEITWPDYDILKADGSLDYFISEIIDSRLMGHDSVYKEGERIATIVMTKGCVARCTFCHRFEKGFRARPVDQIIDHVKMLKSKYNVRFLDIADENFGSDRDSAAEIAEELGRLGIIWRCAGVRVNTVNLEMLLHWKKNGCTSVMFGIESGSVKMLEIMEKKATVEANLKALKAVSDAGLGTIIQLVIGMPGETDETIQETTEFLIETVTSMVWWKDKNPSDLISINYAQALPGTPLYEWTRESGYIGKTLEEEEKYLLQISDTDAYESDHFINYTGLSLLRVLMWPRWMNAKLDFAALPKSEKRELTVFQLFNYYYSFVGLKMEAGWLQGSLIGRVCKKIMFGFVRHDESKEVGYDYAIESGYFNIRNGIKFFPLLLNPLTKKYFMELVAVATAIEKGGSFKGFLKLLYEYFFLIERPTQMPVKSLRKIVQIKPLNEEINRSESQMIPLRMGR